MSQNSKLHRSINPSIFLLLLLSLTSCGGGGGDSSQTINTPRPPGAVAVVSGDGQVTVSWNNNGATSYNIYMATQSGVTKSNYTTIAGGKKHTSATNPYTIAVLTNGTPYYFVVTSVNNIGESAESSEVSATPSASVSLTVNGSVKYEDKEYGTTGFTGNTSYQAVRYAAVEAVYVSGGMAIVSATTDVTGGYSLTLPSTANGKTIYIRVISGAYSPASATIPMVSVKSISGVQYAVAGASFAATGAAMTHLAIPVSSPAAGAFNILDVFTSAAQFVQSLSGSYPPAVTAFWQLGNAKGTYYCSAADSSDCSSGAGIYVLNYKGDTDEYDDDVLWHEYGHFIADQYSKDDSPGGVHYLTSNDLDLRLTWSEGWGDFFPSAVKTWLPPSLLSATATAKSMYVDTSGSSGDYFDFAILDNTNSNYFYSSNEAAVAKVLIESSTAHNMQTVWDIFTSIKTATSPVNLETFRDAWYSNLKPDIAAILGERQINYSADSHEGDNSPNGLRKATIAQAEDHTLFGSADIDYIAFDAIAGQKYTIKTTALKNGADTFISIIAPDMTVVTNDNSSGRLYTAPYNYDAMTGEYHENGNDILGSTKNFTAAATGIYYVEVKSSLNKPLSAGKYGEYSLTIASP